MANDGTLPHAEDIACTSHARLAKHVMDEVRHNVGDKSSGATAFPATAILYDVLFNTTADLRGRPILRTNTFPDIRSFPRKMANFLEMSSRNFVI